MSKDYEFYMSHHISQVNDMTPEDQAKYKRGQAEFDRMQASDEQALMRILQEYESNQYNAELLLKSAIKLLLKIKE